MGSVTIKSVNIGSVVQFFIQHNQLVMGVTLAAILLLSSFLLYRIFFHEAKSENSPHLSDGSEIEETLKKILSQTTVTAAAQGAGVAGADGAAKAAMTPEQAQEVEKLRAEVAANQNLIAELKQKANSASAAGSDQTPELLAKIKILEDRLAEYEIIEDDIADLSLYKEENAKLKKELEQLKASSGPVLKNEAATTAVDAVAAAVGSTVDSTLESTMAGAAMAAELMGVDVPSSKPAPESQPRPQPQSPAEPVATSSPAASAPVEAPGTSTTVSSNENVQGSSDVFAEFQSAEGETDLLADLGDLDADRMLEEIKDLGDGTSADSKVLDEDVDLEKMANETKG